MAVLLRWEAAGEQEDAQVGSVVAPLPLPRTAGRQMCHFYSKEAASMSGNRIILDPLMPETSELRLTSRHFILCCFFSGSTRRKTDANVTFDTVCHNPAQALHGVLLDDFNNSKCQMKEVKGTGSQFFICSCSEDECNEHAFFNPSKCSTFTPSPLRFHV